MDLQTTVQPREHHFYVAISKYFFLHPKYGIVKVDEPIRIKDAEQYELSPLVLYGVTVPGLPLRWMTFTPLEHPRALQDVLFEAWNRGEGLRGRPDILRISRPLAKAAPVFVQNMTGLGIHVAVADAKEKRLPASMRAAQEESRWLLWRGDRENRPSPTVQELNQYAQEKHGRESDGLGLSSTLIKERMAAWMSMPLRKTTAPANGELDWAPGAWMSSWEASLPPSTPRYFKPFPKYGEIVLLTKEEPAAPESPDFCWPGPEYDDTAEVAKNIVGCWPNSPAEIAKAAGISLRDLKWFLNGTAPLKEERRYPLGSLLGLGYDLITGSYQGSAPCVLMAEHPLALKEAYMSISQGGDAHTFEVVPKKGKADPSWRYVLILVDEGPVAVMVPRGDRVAERLPSLFLNYDGIIAVSAECYRDIVSSCARACRDPAANTREMAGFAKRWKEQWGKDVEYLE